jgi:hypothetical protein
MHLPAARHCTPIVPGAIVAEAEVTRWRGTIFRDWLVG